MKLPLRPLRTLAPFIGALLIILWSPGRAYAYSCSATSPGTQTFAAVSPVSGSAYAISGTLSVTCTVGLLEGLASGTAIRACLSIGSSAGSTPRTLTNGAYSLHYNLYSDAAHTQVFGSVSSAPPTPVAVDFNLGLLGILLGGSSTVHVSLYGYLTANQIGAPAGLYSQSFSGSGAALNYIAYTGSAPACSGAWSNGGSFAFTVNASVIDDCNISANNIDFGSSGVLSANLTSNGAVTAQCTLDDSYSIALNAGTAPGATPGDRRMVASGGGVAHYQLYTSAGYSSIWGDGTAGTTTVGGTGNGGNQTYVVYGAVPPQSTPNPGSYTDTVTATVTY